MPSRQVKEQVQHELIVGRREKSLKDWDSALRARSIPLRLSPKIVNVPEEGPQNPFQQAISLLRHFYGMLGWFHIRMLEQLSIYI